MTGGESVVSLTCVEPIEAESVAIAAWRFRYALCVATGTVIRCTGVGEGVGVGVGNTTVSCGFQVAAIIPPMIARIIMPPIISMRISNCFFGATGSDCGCMTGGCIGASPGGDAGGIAGVGVFGNEKD